MLTVLSSYAGRLADRFGPGPMITLGAVIVAHRLCAAWACWRRCRMSGSCCCRSTILIGLGMALVVSPLSTAVMTSVEDATRHRLGRQQRRGARRGPARGRADGRRRGFVFERALGGFAELPIFFGMPPETPLDAPSRSGAAAAPPMPPSPPSPIARGAGAAVGVIAWFTGKLGSGSARSRSKRGSAMARQIDSSCAEHVR